MALGINIKQLYGQTEVTGLAVGHRNESVKLNTVGSPMPEVELKISDAGEILIKGPIVFKGYYKNEEATRKDPGRGRAGSIPAMKAFWMKTAN